MSRHRPVRSLAVSLSLCVAALTLSACANPPDAGSPAGTASDGAGGISKEAGQNRVRAKRVAEIAAQVPQAVRDRGTLEVVTFAGLAPPLSFYATDNKTVIGMEPDLARLVADVLGLEPRLHTVSWENMFVGLDSGKYDVAIANITDTEERKRKYDFASYRQDKVAFEALQGSSLTVRGPKDVAGLTVAVHPGTNQEKLITQWSEENERAGRKPVAVKYYQTQSDVYLALRSRRIDLYLGSNPSVAYHVADAGQTDIVGTYSGAGPDREGWIAATMKKDNGLAAPLARAVNELIGNGTYGKAVKRWHLTGEAVTESRVNPPGLP
ncbi:ABC transporter substrate-binding protein [Streptomyces kunmingensis]|uniref:ABC transporter substrate-binding protein n=1 Tax=Streptomyces kunmingensis TaxID=68225 RepID=A0ABU6C9M8_9ACTN|nr:ABC transporter substrate-binding protein [Streptomyces kunmingensis]MEB3960891.1 ABC transporter substrate-binding protein [Streptomyces kunmingensis]